MTLDYHNNPIEQMQSSSTDLSSKDAGSALLFDSGAYTKAGAGSFAQRVGNELGAVLAAMTLTDNTSPVAFQQPNDTEARFRALANQGHVARNGDNVKVTFKDESWVSVPELKDAGGGMQFGKEVKAKVTERNGVITIDDISGISIGAKDSFDFQRYGLSKVTITPGGGDKGQDRITVRAGWGVHFDFNQDLQAGTAAQIQAEMKRRGLLK